ncbi:MAG: hypothetical protein MRY23_02765 [Pelagibacteraceae bacterium]|nr:hypothetical protein [Pelagibacteraceae bacterium]MCI5079493.1 hypothetical protein [Pelagibacteraceae bacterium]
MLASKGKKNFFFYLILFLLFTTFQINQNNTFPFFLIKKVTFLDAGNFEENIKNNITESLIGRNLFNIKKQKIDLLFTDSRWVKSYLIKKKYPEEIFFQISEYKPLAIHQKKDNLYLINDNFLITDKILNKNHNLDLIIIIGEYSKKNFKKLYKEALQHDFLKDLISIKFLNLDRVELFFKDNIHIKLGKYSYASQFNIISKIIKNNNYYKLIDLRNEGTVIVK